jgi:glucose-6-phosphate isomerase
LVIRLSLSNLFAAAVGKADGLTDSEWAAALKAHEPVCKTIRAEKDAGRFGFAKLPYNESEVARARSLAERMAQVENFIHVGIGGSVLGAQVIVRALTHPYYNDLPPAGRSGRPRIFFIDNVDPGQMAGLFDAVNLKRSMVFAVTKSGETLETVAAMHILYDALRRTHGDKARERLVVATDPVKGYLRAFARQERLTTFDIPPDVGGRFSALTPVGLVPAAVAGIDPAGLLEGARSMDRQCAATDPRLNPAAQLAAAAHGLYRRKNKRLFVFMPYSSCLESLADWFVQLWAESLGKKMSTDGRVVHEGHTPLRAVGARDQHSLIQLLNEGPNDKLVAMVEVARPPRDIEVPPGVAKWEHLGRRKVSEILAAERVGTEAALTSNGRPNLTLSLADLSAPSLGETLYLLEMAVVHFARLLKVNPFDQPGVEAGKKAALELLQAARRAPVRRRRSRVP